MTEGDIFTDLPSEPKVLVPKASLIDKETNNYKKQSSYFKDLCIKKKLGEAKFPVYLVSCNNKNYAMKIFPLLEEHEKHPYFRNEIRFASFNHPNVIKIVHIDESKDFIYRGNDKKIAFILMEYAPHGDLHQFVVKYSRYFDEKLARTYFRQLIEGLEYIHSKNAAHLDLKLDNLLLDENLNLKIGDFDLSCFVRDSRIRTRGTKCYRAPELGRSLCQNFQAADIYSAGILLFVLKTGGVLPHSEEIYYKGIDLFGLLNQNDPEFWSVHCEIQHKPSSFFDVEFRDLFNSMVDIDPEKRLKIQDIKNSKWYKGPIYTGEEVKKILNLL